MKGNVLEWCADWHVPYTQDEQLDPVHPSMTESKSACRIVRGGSWNDDADASRPGFRFWLAPKNANPLLGFRLARDVPPS
jgi:formylglycine-generating enzyme required for sulfatase activity